MLQLPLHEQHGWAHRKFRAGDEPQSPRTQEQPISWQEPSKVCWFLFHFPPEDNAPLQRCDFTFTWDNSWGELGIHQKLQRATGTMNSWADHADTVKIKRKWITSLHKYTSQGASVRFLWESSDFHDIYKLTVAFSTMLPSSPSLRQIMSLKWCTINCAKLSSFLIF